MSRYSWRSSSGALVGLLPVNSVWEGSTVWAPTNLMSWTQSVNCFRTLSYRASAAKTPAWSPMYCPGPKLCSMVAMRFVRLAFSQRSFASFRRDSR